MIRRVALFALPLLLAQAVASGLPRTITPIVYDSSGTLSVAADCGDCAVTATGTLTCVQGCAGAPASGSLSLEGVIHLDSSKAGVCHGGGAGSSDFTWSPSGTSHSSIRLGIGSVSGRFHGAGQVTSGVLAGRKTQISFAFPGGACPAGASYTGTVTL